MPLRLNFLGLSCETVASSQCSKGEWGGAYPLSSGLRRQNTQHKVLSLKAAVTSAKYQHLCLHSPSLVPPRRGTSAYFIPAPI